MKYTLIRYAMLILAICFGFNGIKAQNDTDNIAVGTIATDFRGIEMVYVPTGTVEMGIEKDVFRDLITNGIFSEYSGMNTLDIQEADGVFEIYETNLRGFWIDRCSAVVFL